MTELNLSKIKLSPEVVQLEVNSTSSQEEVEVLEALVISVVLVLNSTSSHIYILAKLNTSSQNSLLNKLTALSTHKLLNSASKSQPYNNS